MKCVVWCVVYVCEVCWLVISQKALQDFTVSQGRTEELQSLPDLGFILDENAYFSDSRLGRKEQRRLHMPSSLKRNLAFCLPGTRLSVDFFKEQVRAVAVLVCLRVPAQFSVLQNGL